MKTMSVTDETKKTEDRSLVINVDPGRPTPELVRKTLCICFLIIVSVKLPVFKWAGLADSTNP